MVLNEGTSRKKALANSIDRSSTHKRFLMVGEIRLEGQILLGERWKKREIEFISSVDAYRGGAHLGSGVHQFILRVTRTTISKLFSRSSNRHHPARQEDPILQPGTLSSLQGNTGLLPGKWVSGRG